jgi:citronellol/citronellal dehydrogenase
MLPGGGAIRRILPMGYRSVFRPRLFAGQTIVITGGGTGIGRCTALELTSLGARIALVGRRPERLEQVAAEIADDGGSASVHPCDIRDEEGVRNFVRDILERHGRIDGLVNNAGGQYYGRLRDMKTKGWEAVIRSNLTGGFIVSREVYLAWMEANGGAIVNIVADVDGGWPLVAHSGAARAGMINLTQSQAAEWAQSGVRANAVAPGAITTYGSEYTYSAEEYEVINHFDPAERIPLRRRGVEAEVSAAIVFLLSPAASYITGSVVRVDGGSVNARQLKIVPAHDNIPPFDGLHRPPPEGY